MCGTPSPPRGVHGRYLPLGPQRGIVVRVRHRGRNPEGIIGLWSEQKGLATGPAFVTTLRSQMPVDPAFIVF